MTDDARQTFERLYCDNPDPWNFATSRYEQDKRAATLAALPSSTFDHVLEVGCGPGFLTCDLADRAGVLLALDISAEAIRLAQQRTAKLDHVHCRQARLPEQWPAGHFDLIVLSEVLYFLSPAAITDTSVRCKDSLRDDGFVLLVNWTGESDLPISGEEAEHLFIEATGWRIARAEHHTNYRIALLETV